MPSPLHSQAMGELAESFHFLDPQHMEGVQKQRLSLQRAGYDGRGEAPAQAGRLGEVKIAARPFRFLRQSFQFLTVFLLKRFARDKTGVVHPAQDHQGADFVRPRQPVRLCRNVCAAVEIAREQREGHQYFGGRFVAPLLDIVIRHAKRLDVRYGRLSQPDMGQFVRQGEHLGRFVVGPIDEHEGGQVVGDGESPELVGVEPAMGVVSDDAAAHDHDSRVVGLMNEKPEGFRPGSQPAPLLDVESQRAPDIGRDARDVGGRIGGTDERRAIFMGGEGVFTVPFLSLLAQVDGVEQIGTRALRSFPGRCSEIGKGHGLTGRLA